MELFREVSHCLKPSAKDWLALRFLQAAKTRWGQLRGRCTQVGVKDGRGAHVMCDPCVLTC